MSIAIQLKDLDETQVRKMAKELVVSLDEDTFNTTTTGSKKRMYGQKSYQTFNAYNIVSDTSSDCKKVYVPFDYGISIMNIERPPITTFERKELKFIAQLRPEQEVVKNETMEQIRRKGSALISTYTGFGKSILAVYLCCKFKTRTMILIPNKSVLLEQWKQSFFEFTNLTEQDVEIVVASKKASNYSLDLTKTIHIMNAVNVVKLAPEDLKKIGGVIIDEIHLIMTPQLVQSLLTLAPRYFLGLSATPYRPDGLNRLIHLFAGKNEYIVRAMDHPHDVFKISTGIVPEIQLTASGQLDWNHVISSLAVNTMRNQLIIRILQVLAKDYVFLVPCKRISQAQILLDVLPRFLPPHLQVSSFIGNQKTFDRANTRILISTIQKCGVGFDFPKLNALLLATDVQEYFVQYLGRVFRTQENRPLIIDLVDRNECLQKHWRTRKSTYIKQGGIIHEVSNVEEMFDILHRIKK